MTEAKPRVKVKLLTGYEFKVTYSDSEGAELIMDEPPPLGTMRGPNASRVLASAIANCLSASLLFCLRKSKVEVDDVETEAEPTVLRNEEGYWRVKQVDVSIKAKVRELADSAKVKRCLEIFEKYCVVTGAVRGGIPVNISVDTGGVN